MKFFYADSQDQIDANYDFIRERFSTGGDGILERNAQVDDKYFHEFFDSLGDDVTGRTPTSMGYHGMLVSLHTHASRYRQQSSLTMPELLRGVVQKPESPSLVQQMLMQQPDENEALLARLRRNRRKKRKSSKMPKSRFPIMMDSGAFSYIKSEFPPYQTEQVVEQYENLKCTYGVALDHIPTAKLVTQLDGQYRRALNTVPTKEGTLARYQKKMRELVSERSSNNAFDFIEDADIQLPTPAELTVKEKIDKVESEILKNKDIINTYEIERAKLVAERDRRWELSMVNARDFIAIHRQRNASFIPIGTAHGWDVETYADATRDLMAHDYPYVAVGGLVPVASDREEVMKRVEAVARIVDGKAPIHLFGISIRSPADMALYQGMGVASFDSSSPMTCSMKDAENNYWSDADGGNYIALRIPRVGSSPKIDRNIESGKVDHREALRLDNLCMEYLRTLNTRPKASPVELTELLQEYHSHFYKPGPFKYEQILRTIEERPWTRCQCKVCRRFGVETIILRGTVRNKARGFHNIWQLGNWVRQGGNHG